MWSASVIPTENRLAPLCWMSICHLDMEMVLWLLRYSSPHPSLFNYILDLWNFVWKGILAVWSSTLGLLGIYNASMLLGRKGTTASLKARTYPFLMLYMKGWLGDISICTWTWSLYIWNISESLEFAGKVQNCGGFTATYPPHPPFIGLKTIWWACARFT